MTSPPDLARHAAAIASSRGWTLLREAGAPPGDYAAVVSGGDLMVPACLRVTEAPGEFARHARVAARSEHVLGLVEELPARRGRGGVVHAEVLEEAPGGTLGEVLARRPLTAGEAATVLIAVAAGLAALQESGWAGAAPSASGPRPEAVVFRRDGCPALGDLGAIAPTTAAGLQADATAFATLAEEVCRAAAGGELLLTAARQGMGLGGWDRVIESILAVAEPAAVTGLAEERGAPPPTRSRSPASSGASGDLRGRLLHLLLDGNPGTELTTRVRAWLKGRRKLVLVALAPLVAAVVVLLVVPSGGDAPHTPAAVSTTANTATASPRAPTATPRARDGTGADPTTADPTTADDPVEAATALLARRDRCFAAAQATASCLDGIVEQGAVLAAEEVASLAGKGWDSSEADITLVGRWGGAALVSVTPRSAGSEASAPEAAAPKSTAGPASTPVSTVGPALAPASAAGSTSTPASTARPTSTPAPTSTSAQKREPASLLLVRGEAGWRVRAVFS